MTDSSTPSDPSLPTAVRGGLAGAVLVRGVVPAWVLAGAIVKLATFNPALLPEPILDLVRSSAAAFGIADMSWWLESALRFFVAVEIAAAIVMIAAPRLARFTASFLLTVFLAVLVASMTMSARRDGLSSIWSGSCGCFGSASPPPIGMFGLDLALLLGVIFLRPRSVAATPWRWWVVVLAFVAGGGIAFGRPKPVIVIQVEDPSEFESGSDPVAPGDVASEEVAGWGAIPTEVEPFYAPEFQSWIGTPLSEQVLARLISRPLPGWIDTARFHLVLYRADCDHCHDLLDAHFSGSLETPVIAVEVPDTDPESALPMPCLECVLHTLPEGPNYVFSTPVLLTVEDGVVIAVNEGGDDPAAVHVVIQARRTP